MSTTLNLHHPNYPPCNIPFLSSHTFHLFSPPLRMQRSSTSVQPRLLSYHGSRSHRSLASSPKSWTGGTTWQTRTAVCLAVFFQAFVHRMIKKKKGARGAFATGASRGDICEGLLRVHREITHRMRQADNRMGKVDEKQGSYDGLICSWHKYNAHQSRKTHFQANTRGTFPKINK